MRAGAENAVLRSVGSGEGAVWATEPGDLPPGRTPLLHRTGRRRRPARRRSDSATPAPLSGLIPPPPPVSGTLARIPPLNEDRGQRYHLTVARTETLPEIEGPDIRGRAHRRGGMASCEGSRPRTRIFSPTLAKPPLPAVLRQGLQAALRLNPRCPGPPNRADPPPPPTDTDGSSRFTGDSVGFWTPPPLTHHLFILREHVHV